MWPDALYICTRREEATRSPEPHAYTSSQVAGHMLISMSLGPGVRAHWLSPSLSPSLSPVPSLSQCGPLGAVCATVTQLRFGAWSLPTSPSLFRSSCSGLVDVLYMLPPFHTAFWPG